MVDKPPRQEHGQKAPQVTSGIQEAAAGADHVQREHHAGEGEEEGVEQLEPETNQGQ